MRASAATLAALLALEAQLRHLVTQARRRRVGSALARGSLGGEREQYGEGCERRAHQ